MDAGSIPAISTTVEEDRLQQQGRPPVMSQVCRPGVTG